MKKDEAEEEPNPQSDKQGDEAKEVSKEDDYKPDEESKPEE